MQLKFIQHIRIQTVSNTDNQKLLFFISESKTKTTKKWELEHFMTQRSLEALKQVEAKNLSSSSASLKKLRPEAVLTSTQFCALEKIETNMSACGHVCPQN